LIHQVKDEYVKNERTGKKKRAGFAATGYLVDVNAFMYKNPGEEIPARYHLTVTDCRHNPEAEGFDLSGEDFPALAELVFPESSRKDWE
jgi:hypothetical protein